MEETVWRQERIMISSKRSVEVQIAELAELYPHAALGITFMEGNVGYYDVTRFSHEIQSHDNLSKRGILRRTIFSCRTGRY